VLRGRGVTVALDRSSVTPLGFRDGTHRSMPPHETLAAVLPRLGEFGITRVANVTGLDRIGLPVVMVCRPNARSVAVSQGKGLTLDAAKASGVMESIELWHAERILLPLKLATYDELRAREAVVDVGRLAHNGDGRFQRTLPILWACGTDVLGERALWCPFECVHMNACLPLPAGSGCFVCTSNGLASGNVAAEALSHAICEVVERDATTLWHLRSEDEVRDTLIDLDTVDDTACRAALELCRAAGVSVLAWETTSDVGIPSFACLLTEPSEYDRSVRASASGYGCHPDRGIALLRSLTEAAQSRLTFIAGSRDDLFREEYEDNVGSRASLLRLQAMLAQRGRSFADVPTFAAATLDEDVAWELDRLRAAGVEQVVVFDLGRPEVGLAVVRVVIPGLEGPDSVPEYLPGTRARSFAESRR
jgi:YcaO-like protein with predicted kinase domain